MTARAGTAGGTSEIISFEERDTETTLVSFMQYCISPHMSPPLPSPLPPRV